ncbi:MAG: hypothetical protein ABSG68_14200 [Thermoguttaceae bacterium]|jgi:multidrug resistance efflux pump
MKCCIEMARWCLISTAGAVLISLGGIAQAAETKEAPKPAAEANDAKKEAPKPAAEAKDAKKEAPSDKSKPEAAKTTPAAGKDAADDSAKTHRVKKGELRIEVTLDGAVEPAQTAEIILRPQEWTTLTVLKAIEHGTAVKRGDLLLALDPEKIDRAINELRNELQLSEIAIKQAEQQLDALEKSAPLDNELNERTQRMVQEDSKQFNEVERPMFLKSNDFMLQMSKDIVEYEEEELRQLEKMYRADDLREETEKIVLKRAQDAVKRARFSLERAQAAHDEALKLTLPRQEEKIKELTQRTAIEFQRTRIVLPLVVNKHRLELEKLKVQRTQADEKLNKLLADRALLTVVAPMDGIVYYGKFTRGKWSAGTQTDPLRRGATVMANDVFMTIVQPHPLLLRAGVPEAQVQNVRPGVKGAFEPAALAGTKLPVVVARISAVPVAAGSFDAQFTLLADPRADALVPGMTGEIRLLAYQKSDVLSVPPKAVMTEDQDPQKQFVYVQGKDDKPEKRPITVGRRNDKQVEVLQGLSENDQVLLEKPK